MDTYSTLKVSKIDAAKRQLETALRLWFHSGDPVSIYTLAAAANQVLHDLGSKIGKPSILHEWPGVPEHYKEQLNRAVNHPVNFLKHADRDPDALLDFNPQFAEVFLLDAILTYETLTMEGVPIFSTFKTWAFVHHPEILTDKVRKALGEAQATIGPDVSRFSRSEFFRHFMLHFMKVGTEKS